MNPNMAVILQGLTPEELQQCQDVVDYITERANAPGGQMAEGSIASLLNRQSPRVRERFRLLSEILETPRVMPFGHKFSEAEHAQNLGLGHEALLAKDALDTQEVMAKLQQRMGTDADLPQEEITMRELLNAATEAHNGK